MKFQIKTNAKGSAIIEFAILLPVFILLILGVIEAGWALYIQSSLSDAAREGARVAVTANVGSSAIVNTINSLVDSDKISTNKLSVSISPIAISLQPRGTPITVNVSLPYSSASILPAPLFLGNVTLQAQVTMTKEY